MKITSRLTLLLTIVLMSVTTLFAQGDINAAGAIFNDGNEALKAKNYQLAVTKYQEALNLCDMIGMDADDLKYSIEKQIPTAQYYHGLNLVKNKKATQGLKVLKEALANAEATNNNKIIRGSQKYISKILGSVGYNKTKKEDYEGALKTFDEALSYTPESGDIHLYQGMTYKNMGDNNNMDEALLKAVEYARAENNEKTAMNAIKIGRSFYLGLVQKDINSKDYNGAIANAEKVLKYDDKNGLAYYFIAVANNNLKNVDAAIDAATKSLEFSDSAQETQAGIHLELGKAYESKGDNAKACEEYNLAAFGNFKAEADYKIKEVIKCK